MPIWTFKKYISSSGQDPIGDWYQELPPKAAARFDVILGFLRDNPNTQWPSEWFSPLTGYTGIFEIRFNVNNVLYRPLGYFGPTAKVYTLLVPAREQGDKFVPKNAPILAVERKRLIERGEVRVNECDF